MLLVMHEKSAIKAEYISDNVGSNSKIRKILGVEVSVSLV